MFRSLLPQKLQCNLLKSVLHCDTDLSKSILWLLNSIFLTMSMHCFRLMSTADHRSPVMSPENISWLLLEVLLFFYLCVWETERKRGQKSYLYSSTIYSEKWPALTLGNQVRKSIYPPVFCEVWIALLYAVTPNIHFHCSIRAFGFLQCEEGVFFSFWG